jgi:peptide/nickel transport system permease protein
MLFAQREFVLAARALGGRNRRIIFRELLPNVALPLVSYGFIVVAALIVAEASLSFLGLSIQRPTPTWGNMIAAGQADFDKHPHLVFIPGTVLFITVFALNKVGDKARRLWDPRKSSL